jgi:hypothetical protein
MDISGFEATLIGEINRYSILENSESFQFQNHMYGCFSVLEMICENEIDISGLIIGKNENSFDLSGEFHLIGCEFGFYEGEKGKYISYSDEYKKEWLHIINLFYSNKDLQRIDELENNIFKHISKLSYFSECLKEGELNSETVKRGETLFIEHPVSVSAFRIKFNGHTRRVKGRRSITPIHKKRRNLNRTKKVIHK